MIPRRSAGLIWLLISASACQTFPDAADSGTNDQAPAQANSQNCVPSDVLPGSRIEGPAVCLPPVFNADGVAVIRLALAQSSVGMGTENSVGYTLVTNRPVTFVGLFAGVNHSNNVDDGHLDFATHSGVTLNGTQSFSDSRSWNQADNYQVGVIYTLDGVTRVRLPLQIGFSVTGTGGGSVTPDAGIPDAGSAGSVKPDAGAPPSFNVDGVAVTAIAVASSNVNVGQIQQVTYTVVTNRSVTFSDINGSVRDSANLNNGVLDFTHHTAVTVNGTRTFTDSRSWDHADTYRVSVGYTLDGTNWVHVDPTRTFTVGAPSTPTPTPAPVADWTLSWSDEFNAPDGTAVDSSKWGFEVGSQNGGWGNQELEYYTNSTNNAVQRGGMLVITARKEAAPDGFQYTSARLLSKGKFTQQYGRFEARIQVPAGQGMWPGWWMLGDNYDTVGWPNCGEIDIMENIGREPKTIHGSAHGPGYSGGNSMTATYDLPNPVSNDFHVYAVEWEVGVIRWYVDSTLYETRTPDDVAGKTWVYNRPFYLLMNLAVGGNWPGAPDGTTVFPAELRVDYVRVYTR